MDIGIRYCGGCNPYYDAQKAVKRIEEGIGMKLLPAGNRTPDYLVLIKQCSSDCFPEPEKLSLIKTIVVTGEDRTEEAIRTIRKYMTAEKENRNHDE